MTKTITATEAVRKFSEILNSIKYTGNDYTIMRGGKPVATIRSAETHAKALTLGDLAGLVALRRSGLSIPPAPVRAYRCGGALHGWGGGPMPCPGPSSDRGRRHLDPGSHQAGDRPGLPGRVTGPAVPARPDQARSPRTRDAPLPVSLAAHPAQGDPAGGAASGCDA